MKQVDPDAAAIGELFRKAREALHGEPRAEGEETPPLREGEILPPKCRQAVTNADQCHWCEEPFIEPKRKRFVIMDETRDRFGWALHSICFECFKRHGDNASSDSGLDLERATRACQGCGEPMSLPVAPAGRVFRGTFRWFDWCVCSMRCYQRAYRERRRKGGGSTVQWKWDGRPRQCATCRRSLKPSRKDTRYCSNACRQKAYRRAHTPPKAEHGNGTG